MLKAIEWINTATLTNIVTQNIFNSCDALWKRKKEKLRCHNKYLN